MDLQQDVGNLKHHLPYLLLLVVLAIVLYYPFLNATDSWDGADWRLSHQNTLIIMSQALHNHHTLPYWTSLVDAGMPFSAIPDKPFYYPITLFLLVLFSPVVVMNYS